MGNELTKIDRALECQVIDWLMWGGLEDKFSEPSMPDLALEILSKRKLALIAEQEKVRKLTEALEFYASIDFSKPSAALNADKGWTARRALG